uniref:Uncharacterized protein n=1 Tax=Rhizophora mucronata TaxID=61149 RepID=A0A2P2M042_RHIMU
MIYMQLNFFRKGLQSLEAVEPHVRVVTEQQHIDYQFSGLEDDGRDGNDVNENRELSFEYRANKQGQDAVSASRNSMEVDEVDLLFPQMSTAENAELNLEKNGGIHVSSREPKGSSHSAPILPERKSDPVERFRQMQQPTARQSNAYVLPTPLDAKGAISSRAGSSVPLTRPTDLSGGTHNLSHSSPLEQKKHEKDLSDRQLQEFSILKPSAGQKDSYSNSISTPLPPPLLVGVLVPQPTSPPKVSPRASPPFASSPRVSELHELPRPPGNLITKAAKPSVSIVHSAPLVRNPEPSGTNKAPYAATNVTSRLPTPLLVSRSFSIPSSSQRAMAVHVSKLLGPPKVLDKAKGVGSPPVTPIYPANNNPASSASQMVAHSGQIRGGS